ncbi:hypothetical protein [Acinetobacter oleivorans]|uniref:hypothetical protein n=1 Tax=Acinetobacter oleivorans TaxID=1148157 RepID=UPI002B25E284|nr:hypothetical protein [Acinetobacter oleivorans]WQF74621.1 hypothetical protein OKW95_08945 [Acinetobacter oleivorans]
MNNENLSQNNGLKSYNPDTHYIQEKTTYWKFVGFEFIVLICISTSIFISTYLGTNFFSSKEQLEKIIVLYTDFFSIQNIVFTIIGIFTTIGFLNALNMTATNFALNLNSLFKRLTFSGIDFIYLMISTMLGFSFAAFVFILNQPITPEIVKLKESLFFLIIMLIIISISYIPTFMVLPHREKISDFKKKK